MAQKLIFVRHAAVEIDPAVPSNEWRLSDNGRSLTHHLIPQIAVHNPTRIITSSENKARETGQIIADVLGSSCQTAPNLHEHERSRVGYFEHKADFVTAVHHFFTHPNQLVFGDETANQARERFDTAVHHLIAQHPHDANVSSETLAIVTHGTVLTLFLAHYNQIEPFHFWQTLELPDYFVVSLPDFTFHESRFTL
jgi:broad specificity phosphatase PhoE